jgi:hypothetical protein
MTLVKPLKGGAALLALGALTACGGGSYSPPAPAPLSAEEQASASVAGYVAFARMEIAGHTSDVTEPRDIDGIRAPVSDTDEPAAI